MRDLDFWVDRVESRIREIDPEAVTVVTRDTYEDEDVDILVYSDTEEMSLRIGAETSNLTTDVLCDEGYNILVLPMVKSDEKMGKKVAS